MKYTDVEVTPLAGHKYKLLKALYFKDIKVPRGYRTNGADIPRVFWWLLPPNDSTTLPAVIIHDFLCDKEQYRKADRYFLELMTELGVVKWRRNLMYYSVRAYHKLRYKE